MENQVILACDDDGNFLEYIPRMAGHIGGGRRHTGITIIITNNKSQMLLQRRKHRVFDNIWCFSADTHIYHLPSGKNETLEEAALRALKEDFNILDVTLSNLGFFNYFGKEGELCENEHCATMVGEYNGEVESNPKAVYEYVWMEKGKFLKDFKNNPKKYAIWVPGGVEVLKGKGFFG